MSTTKRLGAILVACLLLVAAATPLASAQPAPLEPEITMEIGGPAYAVRGGEATIWFKLTNTGTAPVNQVVWKSSICELRIPAPDVVLPVGEHFRQECTVKVPDGATSWLIEGKAAADYRGNGTETSAELRMYAATIYKEVVRYWNDGLKVIDPSSDDVKFPVELSLESEPQGVEHVSVAEPLGLLVQEGLWEFTEIRPFPAGYQAIIPNGEFVAPTRPVERTLTNLSTFDLKVEKTGPVWAYEGDVVIWTYEVTNAGPASVTPEISDNKCGSIAYIEGDTDKDGMVDPDETWIYKCRRVPTWDGKTPFTNTVRVWDKEGARIDPPFGGDVNLRNNTDSFTLYPFTLEKAMFLYYGRAPDQVPIKGFEKVEFGVTMSRNGTHVANLVLSEAMPVKVWLSEGPWKFVERRIPVGFKSADPDGIMFDTKDYEHTYAYPNTVDFDLKVKKKLWWGEPIPGKVIAYKYKVTNAGPASVTPEISDDLCSPLTFKWGDKNGNGLVDPGETWVYKCTYRIPYGVHEVTNTVTVHDAEGKGLTPAYGGDVNLDNNTATLTLKIGWHGCPYYKWKQPKHFDEWPTGYYPDRPVGPVFGLWAKLDLNRDGTPDTMLDALHYKGGHGIKYAKKMLLKQGVTALLNEAAYAEEFPPYDSVHELKMEVKRTFKSGKKWKMKKLTKQLKHWNMGYCPL